MSTHIYNAVRIPKASILDYAKIAKMFSEKAVTSLTAEAYRLTKDLDASCAIAVKGEGEHAWSTISDEAYNVVSWYWSIMDNSMVCKLRKEEKELLMDYMKKVGISDPEALYSFLRVCSFALADRYEFQFYEVKDEPFALMRWTSLPSDVAKLIYDTYPEYCYQDQSEAPSLKNQNEDLGSYVESRLEMIDELDPEMRSRIMQLVADGCYQERERVWDKMTNMEFTISAASLRYPFLTTQDKIKYTRALIVRKYKEVGDLK